AVRLAVATATLTITSDDPKAPPAKVTLIGRGDDSRRPDICVTPETLDFGFVPAGGIAGSSFVIRSCGTNELEIDRIAIDPQAAPFVVATATVSRENPGRLAPGKQVSVSLRAQAPMTATGTITARVLIDTNVPMVKNVPDKIGEVQLPIHAKANLPP